MTAPYVLPPPALSPPALPATAVAAAFEAAYLCQETISVISLRGAALARLGAFPTEEAVRMVLEKPPAFMAAGIAAWSAAFQGSRGDEVLSAAIRSLRIEARANAARLTKAG